MNINEKLEIKEKSKPHPSLYLCSEYYRRLSTEKKIEVINIGSRIYQYLEMNPVQHNGNKMTSLLLDLETKNEDLKKKLREQKIEIRNIKEEERDIFEERLDNLHKKYEDEKKSLLLDLETKNEDLKKKLRDQKIEISNIKQEERELFEERLNNIHDKNEEEKEYYQNQINRLRLELSTQRDDLRSNIKNEISELLKTKEEYISSLEHQLNVNEKQFQDIRNDHLREISNIKTQLEETRQELLNEKEEHAKEKIENVRSVTRGEKGESFVMEEFEKYWSNDWDFHNISKQARSMDIIMYNPILNIKGGIEVKSYTSTVSTREVTKFRRDFELKKEYQFGIFVSLTTSIANKDDFHVEYCETTGRPLIYISKLQETPRIILVIESYVKQWYYLNRKYNKTEKSNYLEILHNNIIQSIDNYKLIIKNAKQIIKTAESQLLSNEKIRNEIDEKPNVILNKNNIEKNDINIEKAQIPSIIPLFNEKEKKQSSLKLSFEKIGEVNNKNLTINKNSIQDYLDKILEQKYGKNVSMDVIIKKIPSEYLDNDRYNTEMKRRRYIINEIKNYIERNKLDAEYKKRRKIFINLNIKNTI
jgi:hypothetical protein